MIKIIKKLFIISCFFISVTYTNFELEAEEISPISEESFTEEDLINVTIQFENEVDLSILPSSRIEYVFDTLPIISAIVTDEEYDRLNKLSQIKNIFKEKPIKISSQTRDWGHANSNILLMNGSGLKGDGIKIAVLDSGIDLNHPDLKVAGGKNFITNNNQFGDDNGHGTHVAGIIAALDNKIGVVGVAPNSKIYSLKILDSKGEGTTIDLAEAIDWSIEHKIDIINLSFGLYGSDPIIEELLKKAYSKGMLIVGASGNDNSNSISFPANLDNVIAVGAIDQQQKRALFSNKGNELEISAPGVDVLSTYLNNGYTTMSGTSMASPYVSGYLALLKQKYPTLSNGKLRQLLGEYAVDLGAVGRDSYYGHGIIQSFVADYFVTTDEALPIYDNRSGSLKIVGYLEKDEIYPTIGNDYFSWHQIQFDTFTGFVRKQNTKLAFQPELKNKYTKPNQNNRQVTMLTDTPIYDNSSGTLIPFGTIKKGASYTILVEGNKWIGLKFANRIGYVKSENVRVEFTQSDKYFKTTTDHVPIYDNRSGSLVEVGQLTKGQIYPRTTDYGNWHQIQFGNYFGYVRKFQTEVATTHKLLNMNESKNTSKRTFKASNHLVVYDNTSGSLVPFGVINKGISYVIYTNGSKWVGVQFANRIGYVKQSDLTLSFTETDKYFSAAKSNVPIFDNRTGSLIKVGTLLKGQIYPRTQDYGNWHQIQFGDHFAYVKKALTKVAISHNLSNINTLYQSTKKAFMPQRDLIVYDNTSGSLVPFGTISKGTSVTISKEYTTWNQIIFANRVGFIRK
ncbi:S8 family peptidase [Bacillus weihaiensis]|uniref:S8 family peptidase n=1 Tax=Bacillus weihaiensis TaxID=1547283 RepID=UPI00235774D1|nr:S8 family peptidase [Bacillus weihaiensis]